MSARKAADKWGISQRRVAVLCSENRIENAKSEYEVNSDRKMFAPQNWIKSKTSLNDIRNAIRNYLTTLKMMPNGKEILDNLNNGLSMEKENFEARCSTD